MVYNGISDEKKLASGIKEYFSSSGYDEGRLMIDRMQS